MAVSSAQWVSRSQKSSDSAECDVGCRGEDSAAPQADLLALTPVSRDKLAQSDSHPGRTWPARRMSSATSGLRIVIPSHLLQLIQLTLDRCG